MFNRINIFSKFAFIRISVKVYLEHISMHGTWNKSFFASSFFFFIYFNICTNVHNTFNCLKFWASSSDVADENITWWKIWLYIHLFRCVFKNSISLFFHILYRMQRSLLSNNNYIHSNNVITLLFVLLIPFSFYP